MSAYIVEDKTINRIVSWLLDNEEDPQASFRLRYAAERYGIALRSGALAEAMFQLNCEAVDARYREGTSAKDHPEPFQVRYVPCLSKIQVLKSLQCWLYQCSEGTCDETPLYHFMDEVSGMLALDIVSELPAWEQADWG